MGVLDALVHGFGVALEPARLLACFVGVLAGTLVGILPGLGPAATIALLLPVTYHLDTVSAIIMLAGIYYGSQYGGSTTAILLHIPGESSSLMTTIDGYQMSLQGRAGPALGMAAIASFIAGTLAVVGLMFVAPQVGRLALAFGPAEYFSLMLLGLMLVAYLTGGAPLKAVTMVIAGMLVGTIGQDPVTGTERYTFGISSLIDGVGLVPVFMGLFGVAEVLSTMEQPPGETRLTAPKGLMPTKDDFRDSAGPIARGTFLGFLLGVLPGGGATIASVVSYVTEKRFARHRDRLGTGVIEGVAAPEAANNAASTGSFIPLLTLGIPTNVVMAMMLAALTLQGVRPGPLLIQQQPALFWGTIASMYIGNVILIVLNLPLVGVFVRILRLPYAYLAPVILLVCLIGAYSVNVQIADVAVMVAFGVIGWLFRKLGFDATPFVLALILGRPMEESLRLALSLSQGDFTVFVREPISAVLLAAALLTATFPFLQKRLSRGRA